MDAGIATYEGVVYGDTFAELDTKLNSKLQEIWPGDGFVEIERFVIKDSRFSQSKFSAEFRVRLEHSNDLGTETIPTS